MKTISLLIWIVPGLLMAASTPQFKELKSESDEESSLVTILFNQKLAERPAEIEKHSTFVQVKIFNAVAEKYGEFFDSKSPFYRKIALFKTKDGHIGIRLFTTQEPKTLVDSLSTQVLGSRVMIHLDHKTVPPPITGIPTAAEVVAKTKVRNDIPDPVKQISGKAKSGGGIPFSWQSNLKYLAGLSAVLIMLVVGSRLLRKFLSKTGYMPAQAEAVKMRAISNYPLNNKQKLTLMEIGKQQVLLGVSADSINYLTVINQDEQNLNQPRQPAYQPQQPAYEPQPVRPRKIPEQNSTHQHPTQKTLDVAKKKAISQQYKKKEPTKSKAAAPVANKRTPDQDQKSIEDVTNLIRRKLKNLPNV